MHAFHDPDRGAQVVRSRLLATWIIENADKIDGQGNIQIIFNCAGSSIIAELKNRHTIDIGKTANGRPRK